jgi:hypothetical protein
VYLRTNACYLWLDGGRRLDWILRTTVAMCVDRIVIFSLEYAVAVDWIQHTTVATCVEVESRESV